MIDQLIALWEVIRTTMYCTDLVKAHKLVAAFRGGSEMLGYRRFTDDYDAALTEMCGVKDSLSARGLYISWFAEQRKIYGFPAWWMLLDTQEKFDFTTAVDDYVIARGLRESLSDKAYYTLASPYEFVYLNGGT